MNPDQAKLKKIGIDQLSVGMFVVNLGRSWLSHPFLRNQLKITSDKQIEKMRKYGIREVYIDPERGLNTREPAPEPKVPAKPSGGNGQEAHNPEATLIENIHHEEEILSPLPRPKAEEGPEGHEAFSAEVPEKSESADFWEKNIEKLQGNLLSLHAPSAGPVVNPVPFDQEIKIARKVQEEAQVVIRQSMHEVRMGRSIESERVKRVVHNMVDSILRNNDALVSLTRLKTYDEYTFIHSLDVCILCLSMARHLSLPREEMMEFGIGALLHDLGKMKISPHILKKPGRLTPDEWIEMRKHPVYSLEMMAQGKDIPEPSQKMALQHHERYDGSGYPFGLKGDEAGVFAQVAAIVDCYDAITSDRPYKKAIQAHEGVKLIYEKAGGEFSSLMVERFIQCIGIYPFGTLVLLDTEEVGIVCGVNGTDLLRPKVLVIRQDSRKPYPQPFLADLTEKSDEMNWFRRSIVMPLDARKWNIRLDLYFAEIRRVLNMPPVPA